MIERGWRYAFASVIGSSHVKQNGICQDASACAVVSRPDEEVLIAVASDGAGSAPRSAEGAKLVCDLFISDVQEALAEGTEVADLGSDFAAGWLERFRFELGLLANGTSQMPRDFACTFLAVVAGNAATAFFQIGDGAIVYGDSASPETYRCKFWPAGGEYANQTYFATEVDAIDHLMHEVTDTSIREVAVLTDGLQRLALDFSQKSAHSPFFRPIFKHARLLNVGFAASFTDSLKTYLNSAAVNARTDDDKTLLLATRHPAETVEATKESAGVSKEDESRDVNAEAAGAPHETSKRDTSDGGPYGITV